MFSDLKHFQKIPRNGQLFLLNEILWTTGLGIFLAIFNLYLLGSDFSLGFIGLSSSIRLLSTGILAVPVGIVASRIGLRNAMLLGNIILFIALSLQLTARQPSALLVFIAVEGLAETMRRVVKSPFMAEQTSLDERHYLFSSNAAAMNFSRMTGSVLGGYLPVLFVLLLGLEDRLALDGLIAALWFGVGLVGIGTLPLAMMRVKPPTSNGNPGRQLARALRSPIAWQLVTSFSLTALGTGLVVPLFNVFLAERFGAGTAEIGTILALSLFVLSVLTLLSPAISRRFGTVNAVTLSQIASLPFLIMIVLLPGLFWAGLASILRLAFMDMMVPAVNTLSMNLVDDDERASVNSMIRMGQASAEGIAAGMAGWMMEHWGYTTPYIIAQGIYLLAIAHFYFRFRKYDRGSQNRIVLG